MFEVKTITLVYSFENRMLKKFWYKDLGFDIIWAKNNFTVIKNSQYTTVKRKKRSTKLDETIYLLIDLHE